MQKKEKNGSDVAEQQTTKIKAKALTDGDYLLKGSVRLINFEAFKDLDIKSIGKIIIALAVCVLGLAIILIAGLLIFLNILVQNQVLTSGVIFIIILILVKNLPEDKIKALKEFIQSLPARLFK